MFTVSLELPECEGDSPLEAVLDFQAQADQKHLFAYVVKDDSTGKKYVVDMSDDSVNIID